MQATSDRPLVYKKGGRGGRKKKKRRERCGRTGAVIYILERRESCDTLLQELRE